MENVFYRYAKKDKDLFIKAYFGKRQVGYAWFTIEKKEAFLHFIEVKPHFRHLQIGSSLLDGVEAICREHRVDYIEGKFYPSVPKEVALAFYEKNGFHHFRDGYEQYVGKYYERTKPQGRQVRILSFEEYKAEQEKQEAIKALEENGYDIVEEEPEISNTTTKTQERLPS